MLLARGDGGSSHDIYQPTYLPTLSSFGLFSRVQPRIRDFICSASDDSVIRG